MPVALLGALSIAVTVANPALAASDDNARAAEAPSALDPDSFLESAARRLLERDPETAVELGIARSLGIGGRLNDLSPAFADETARIEDEISSGLKAFPPASLSPAQRASFAVVQWYLEARRGDRPFRDHEYPVHQLLDSPHVHLNLLFHEVHPLRNREDAEDYVACLGQVDRQLGQVIEGLARRRDAELLPPRDVLRWAREAIGSLDRGPAIAHPFFLVFSQRLMVESGLEREQRKPLLEAALQAVETSVIPAYQRLRSRLAALEPEAREEVGVSALPGGKDYYARCLRRHTTTAMTAAELHELGKRELRRLRGEMRAAFRALDYPAGDSLALLFDRLGREDGLVPPDEIVPRFEALVGQAEGRLDSAFDFRPKARVTVVGGAGGAFYVAPAEDGSRPGVFHVSNAVPEPRFAMPTLAYHEMVPGHHFQAAIEQEADLPDLRRRLDFTAYVEGWGLYVERLAWELGWYEGDPRGNLGRLRAEAHRAARLVIDTGVHARGWTIDQAVDYLIENTGLPRSVATFEVGRYVAWPGQATAYTVGMLELLDIRERARERLGDGFDLAAFHRLVLTGGSMPLELLRNEVDDWIAERPGLQGEAPAAERPSDPPAR